MTNTDTIPEDKELALLKERADVLGIPYKANIGLEALKAKVNAAVVADKTVPEKDPSAPETQQQMRERIHGEALALVRVRIHNLHPGKRDLPGEIITVANRYIGTVAKFIPFGEATENGYHIPRVIYDELISRRFLHISLKKLPNGQDEVVRRMVPEYNIEILPNLTVEELQDLALKQAAAERLGA
ncbi:MAG: hypothetical protein ACT4OK_10995 [Gemmobacter sp.]